MHRYGLIAMMIGLALAASPTWAQKVYEPKDRDLVKKEEEAAKKWLLVGKTELKPGNNRVKVLVGWEQGRVDTFKIHIEERAVEIIDVEVHYAKGPKDLYELKEEVDAGDDTGLFTFDRSERRYLRKIYIRYRFPDSGEDDRDGDSWKQPALVEILGRRADS